MSVLVAVLLPLVGRAQCKPAPAGQVAWWRAEGNALDQVGSNHGVFTNGATCATGEVGLGFSFNGINSYVQVPDAPALELTSQLTIEFWVKRQRLDAADYVIEKGGDWTGLAVNYAVGLNGTQYGCCLVFTFAGGWRGAGSVADLNWHHCAVVARQGDVNPTFYIDGVQQSVSYNQGTTTINLYPSTRPLHIGAMVDPATGWYYYSKALVDELGVYNRALSAGEIQSIYSAGSAGKCAILLPPGIFSAPTNQVVAVGSNALFSVTALGTAPLAYQWLFNGAPISDDRNGRLAGRSSSTLTLSASQATDAGGYQVVVSNSLGAVTSDVATLAVLVPPSIVSSPQDQTLIGGSNSVFSIVVAGSEPLGYQWLLNGSAIANDTRHGGADTASLGITNIQPSDAGTYTVVVSNAVGQATGGPAVLSVLEPPTFVSSPSGCSVVLGQPASFNAVVSGTGLLCYQWQLNGTDIPGATTNSLVIPAVGVGDLGLYQLVVTNTVGVARSDAVALTPGVIATWGRNDSGQTRVPAGLTNVAMVAGGEAHSLALRTDGTVVGWGGNAHGELNVPAELSNVVAIAAGDYHNLALRADGTVVSWGDNSYGQTNVPAGLSNVVAVAAGNSHSEALRADGSVVTWGNFTGSQTNAATNLCQVAAIAAGDIHALALRSDGTVVAWGLNTVGQTVVPGTLSNVVTIGAGGSHSLAIRADGTVVAWGLNASGQSSVPLTVSNATAVAGGNMHSLALRADGTVASWGDNSYGQTNVPAALGNVVAIASGDYHNLALVGDGRPLFTRQPASVAGYAGRSLTLSATAVGAPPLSFQWQKDGDNIPGATGATLSLAALVAGDQGSYQLTVTNSLGRAVTVPVTVTVLDGVAPFFLSSLPAAQTNSLGSRATLGLSVGGSGPLSYQWRSGGLDIPGATNDALNFDPVLLTKAGDYSLVVSNQFGALTSAVETLKVIQLQAWGASPYAPPASASNVVAVSVGANCALALGTDSKVVSWAISPAVKPPAVPTLLSNAVAIAAGSDHYAALRSDGSVLVWGSSAYGQTNVPAAAAGVTAIAAGYSHDLALRADGTVVAWGYNNYGQTNVPAGLAGVAAVAAGATHSLALKADGTVTGWGNSSAYQPVPVGATSLIAIAAGGYHSLGLRADGTVVGWGQNSLGQTNVPAGLSNVVAIAAGANHSVALRADGTLVAWGNAKAVVPLGDMVYAIQVAAGGDNGVTLFGTRSPAITLQPYSRTVLRGSNTTFIAKATGVPLSYQWRFKGADVPGATTDTLTLSNLQLAQSGAYQLVLSNAYGTASTVKAKLMVTIPLGAALNATNLSWSSSGNAQWFGETDTTYDGVDGACSGDIGDGQESILQATVIGPGRLSWWWKVSSEAYFDKLEFRLNGVSQFAISGEVDWQPVSLAIPSGTQSVQWRYFKDYSYSDGQDAGWVDQVSFVPDPPVITRQPFNQTVNYGTRVLLPVTATGSPPLTYQWLQDGNPVQGGTSSTLSLSSATRRNGGVYTVMVSNGGGGTLSSSAVLKVLVPEQLSAPTLGTDGSLTLSAGDVDGGSLLASDLANFEAQVSTNLTDWQMLSGALTLTNGRLQLRDADCGSYPFRFYRIVEH